MGFIGTGHTLSLQASINPVFNAPQPPVQPRSTPSAMGYRSEIQFRKLLKEIMSKDSESILSPEEIYFDRLVIDVIELVGDYHVVWLN